MSTRTRRRGFTAELAAALVGAAVASFLPLPMPATRMLAGDGKRAVSRPVGEALR